MTTVPGHDEGTGETGVAGRFASFRRIVVKLGSALLVDRETDQPHIAWLETLADDLARLRSRGVEIAVVSSGSIALGRAALGLGHGALKLEESQAAASIGQIVLAETYTKVLERRGLRAGQVLLTLFDTENRRRYLNARSTISTLLRFGVVPIINENDAVATSEIRYGDNDRLAARVASMISADCLVLLSDVDGLYSAPPGDDPNAAFIENVDVIDARIEGMAGDAGTGLSRGGMVTKIEAAKIATGAGATLVIGSGRRTHPIRAIDEGARATWFQPQGTPGTAWKRWIMGTLEPRGACVADDGAVRALRSGKSLLPAGVVSVSGVFSRGDAIVIRDHRHREIGRGLASYDKSEAERIIGRHSRDIESILGYQGRAALVHRDNLALNDERGRADEAGRGNVPLEEDVDGQAL
ncbi:MAG: glutamate 5-kinase [Hyphomicrobiales bacterium]|nr:glutamate 5-kinase [Hyphomicrobiales bacterium]